MMPTSALVERIWRLMRAAHASSSEAASVSISAWPDEIRISLEAEDIEDDLHFIDAEDFGEVLDAAIVRAEVGLPEGYRSTWSDDVQGAVEALEVLERERGEGHSYDLAFIPRSPVTGGDAWELQAGEGEIAIFIAKTLVEVVAAYVEEAEATASKIS